MQKQLLLILPFVLFIPLTPRITAGSWFSKYTYSKEEHEKKLEEWETAIDSLTNQIRLTPVSSDEHFMGKRRSLISQRQQLEREKGGYETAFYNYQTTRNVKKAIVKRQRMRVIEEQLKTFSIQEQLLQTKICNAYASQEQDAILQVTKQLDAHNKAITNYYWEHGDETLGTLIQANLEGMTVLRIALHNLEAE